MTDKSRKIEHYEKQFGIIAIEKGFLTSGELIEALKIQVEEDIKYKTHRLIGEILLNRSTNPGRSQYHIYEITFHQQSYLQLLNEKEKPLS